MGRHGLILVIGLLSGCTMEASPADTSPKLVECTDTRDGERFSFRTANVTNVRVGILGADSCFDVSDDAGTLRTLCSSHEAFIKCKDADPRKAKIE